MMLELIYLFTGIVVGALAAWLITRLYMLRNRSVSRDDFDGLQQAYHDIETNLKIAEQYKNQVSEELGAVKKELSDERNKVIELNRQLSARDSEYRSLQEKLAEQKKELESIREKFTIEFKNLANEILEEKSKKFTDQNKTNIGELLNPLREKIEKFEEKVEKNSKETLQWNVALKEQIRGLKELNLQITKEAENLTKALKGDSKTQGTWGEMQLEAILEKAGLQKDIHYFKERNLVSENGSNQRPDYIIKLPDEKYLVLDSKVSLTAYSNFFNADNDVDKTRYLKNHLDSITGHIKLLSDKNYQNLYEINQPDYVMMFIANEPALTIALKEDMGLYERAMDKNIVLVSATTLLATLRTISYIWKQDLQNKNALEIARQAGSLYDKFISFSEDLIKVGKNLDLTHASYKETMKKLYHGKDNLVRKTERLRELGAKTSKTMDQRLLDRSDE